MIPKIIFECPVCHLHYDDEMTEEQCATYCENNKSCSVEITKLSIERKNSQKASQQPKT